MPLQPLRPSLGGTGLGGQFQGLAGLQLLISLLQVFQQNAPRHSVYHQVMDHQQQPLAAIGQARQDPAQQCAVLQFETALGLFGQPFKRRSICHLGGPQQR
ncbi:hypothetical protein PFLU4_57450 [Pseudomonas fluorescens]|nr:hypothetical protein PFLU4_57450 [Pseudomonas fluorescens]